MNTIKGAPISPGIAIGEVFIKKERVSQIELEKNRNTEEEKRRFQTARLKAIEQLEKIRNKMLGSTGEKEADIFFAHQEILKDPEFISSVEAVIDELRCNAEWAVKTTENTFVDIFKTMDSDYMRERAMDIKDISSRIIRILQGEEKEISFVPAKPVILISDDLTPSDTSQMKPDLVLGIINETGGQTSHAAIIARMLGIPYVVCSGITSMVEDGQIIAFDGEEGVIELDVNESTLSTYSQKQKAILAKNIQLEKLKGTRSITTDGYEMHLAGNIGTPEDADQVLKQDGQSIGLFRTEFLYMNRETLPEEHEQFVAYKETAEKMKGNPVIIRTLDIGGDKELSYLQIPKEENPFLGCRAIRFCLSRIELWKPQLRALLRASTYGNIHIMFPMIASMEELRQAKYILENVKLELKAEGVAFNENIPIGMMIETPAAAMMAENFAEEVDFFSIGTNDLIQYTMAVDRMNSEVAHLYSPYDPAVLRFIKQIVDCAHEKGIWVGICGEAAADRSLLPMWIGLGIDELSMSPSLILQCREYIQKVSKVNCEKAAEQIIKLKTAAEIEETLKNFTNIKDLQ